jgi:hypothetical protein
VSYTSADGRRQILDELDGAGHEIDIALAELGHAYELLDDDMATRLEDELFRPLQQAAGQARRTSVEFAARYDLSAAAPAAVPEPAHGHSANAAIEGAATAAVRADLRLSELQDSMLPIEVGDPQLRAGIEQVRVLLDLIGRRAREITRSVGR